MNYTILIAKCPHPLSLSLSSSCFVKSRTENIFFATSCALLMPNTSGQVYWREHQHWRSLFTYSVSEIKIHCRLLTYMPSLYFSGFLPHAQYKPTTTHMQFTAWPTPLPTHTHPYTHAHSTGHNQHWVKSVCLGVCAESASVEVYILVECLPC